MKIAFLGPVAPYRGGIAQFTNNMVDCLSTEHEVVIFTYKKLYPKLIFPGKSQYETSSVKHIEYPVFKTLTPYNHFTYKLTVKEIIKHNPDILIIKFWIPYLCPAYNYIIKNLKLTNIKIYLLCHNLNFHEKWFAGQYLTYKMIRNTDNVIVLSDNVKKSAEQYNAKNIIKLFHPIYKVKIDDKLDSRKTSFDRLNITSSKIVLFFGFVKYYKGLDIFLKAIPFVHYKNPEIQFIIAGEIYGSENKYKKIINAFPDAIREKILLHNKFIPSDQIADYFNIADVVIAPYRTATQSGVVQLAFSYIRPVIASDIPGLNDFVINNETGLLFENENYIDLSEKINTFFENKFDYKLKILDAIKLYDWSNFTEQFIKAITSSE